MAIFYEMIKGVKPLVSNADTNGMLYNYILWSGDMADVPKMYYSKQNLNSTSELGGSNATFLGNILLSNVQNNSLINLKMSGSLSFTENQSFTSVIKQAEIVQDKVSSIGLQCNSILRFIKDNSNNVTDIGAEKIITPELKSTNAEISKLKVTDTSSFSKEVIMQENLTVNKVINAKDHIEAPYYNTTSDRRAKTNIQEANFAALDIVKNVPVYSFEYKTNPFESTIGIMAQDILQNQDKLDLVSNSNASGENDDYMSLKENRLIYVLWKAIQEQQEEIKQLKSQVEELSNGR